MAYDSGNIFARILRGEIPCKKVYESAHSLAFHDITPAAPVHVLVIPKGAYLNWDDFSAHAPETEIVDFVRSIGVVARQFGLPASGFRILSNAGGDASQTVPHLHVHIFGGKKLGAMLPGASPAQ